MVALGFSGSKFSLPVGWAAYMAVHFFFKKNLPKRVVPIKKRCFFMRILIFRA